MRPDQLHLLKAPSDPRVSPDQASVAYVQSIPDVERDLYVKTIWISGPTPRQLTSGPGDTKPRWSPDGSRVAFLRAGSGEVAQVCVVPVSGGEASVLTDFEHGVKAVEWAPDGRRLVAVGVTPTEEWAGLDPEERDRRPRRITGIPYRYDERGWIHDRKRHLWLIDPSGEQEPVCLTPGDFDDEEPAWSPDSTRVAFITDRDPAGGLASGNDVYEVDVSTGVATRALPRGFWSAVSYSPNGALHALGNTSPHYPVNSYLHRREADGTITNLTGHADRSSVSLAAGPARIDWRGQAAVVGFEDSGSFGVVEVSPEGTITELVGGEQVVTGFAVQAASTVFTAKRWDSPGELYSMGTEGEQRLTSYHEGQQWVRPIHMRVPSGGFEVDAWVFLPPGEQPVPLLLNIHGGPASQYGFGHFDEFQVYVAAGYGVIACNPRGSSGRGEDWVNAVKGQAWGDVDLQDIRAVVEASLQTHPRLDAERMGIMGGSYGGFMTGWVIGREDRWKSAVVERALTDWTSFSGTSDIGGVFPQNYLGEEYPDAWDTWWALSPMSLVHNVSTPTLILHSEEDWRCPIEQAEQYFTALLRNGTETEFLRFPGEGHEMSRSGDPKHRMERFEAILEWHSRHLM